MQNNFVIVQPNLALPVDDSTEQIAQSVSQPYNAQPIASLTQTSNVIAQPEYVAQQIVQPNPQLYLVQSYPGQSGIPVNENVVNLKKKLCCPIISTWILFGFQLILFIYNISTFFSLTIIIGIIGCVVFFLNAYLLTKSAEQCDVKKYKTALYIYIIYFVLYCIFFMYILATGSFVSSIEYDTHDVLAKIIFSFILSMPIEAIILFVLCCCLRVFDTLPNPENQHLVPPQQP